MFLLKTEKDKLQSFGTLGAEWEPTELEMVHIAERRCHSKIKYQGLIIVSAVHTVTLIQLV